MSERYLMFSRYDFIGVKSTLLDEVLDMFDRLDAQSQNKSSCTHNNSV